MRAHVALALFAVLALTVACAQSDASLTTSIKAQLVADDLVEARNIDVDTKERVVTLTGTVENDQEEARAIDIARRTNGVIDVVDNISVLPAAERQAEPTTGFGETFTGDPALTVTVKTRLLADPTVSGLKINVDTKDSVVTLTGTVNTEAEKARALELARQVENVARVEDKLMVRGGAR